MEVTTSNIWDNYQQLLHIKETIPYGTPVATGYENVTPMPILLRVAIIEPDGDKVYPQTDPIEPTVPPITLCPEITTNYNKSNIKNLLNSVAL